MSSNPTDPTTPRRRTRHRDASLFVRTVMGPMTKVLNPLIRRVAGRRHVSTVARIHHRGRRTGKAYVTPASARLAGRSMLVPLTFGEHSDWCRNTIAAGGCVIRFKGVDYRTVDPVVLDGEDARAATRPVFRRRERLMFRMLGITKVLRLDVYEAAYAGSTADGPEIAPIARHGR